ncbi:glycosyltransferase N-terminal domain-containing protein [Xinfangfangia sp. CPCC 101601]|uniref:3-deoxy-D-manno-octulosonic acid transferase n=1 Tax=Pseudogemmobacter lacusdianii TaxID=3069608 RepID=A0ABU0VXW4_9RHOB|nr:glycosyltransferase N-terminal domain-containing protein [Xinfangfangia sp. CPCC 101601]MDQ2066554.1 glycosyltransferase N-terminal domain-containing protein [Xinfangfangia sp. CPCC 101601]
MALNLGLTLYSLAKRRESGRDQPRPARPNGALVWMHAPDANAARGLRELALRLWLDDAVLSLITCHDPLPDQPGALVQLPPPDTTPEARAFLDHWRPDLCLFSEGELRPAMISEAALRQLPLMMADAVAPRLPKERDGWFPGVTRGALAKFSWIGAIDEAASRNFRKAGAAPSAVAVTGRLEEASAAKPGNEAERAALAATFATRPVWFAAALPEAEEAAIIAAHRAALQHAHRLLLIVLPDRADRASALAARAEAEGWAIAHRAQEEEPEAHTEVFLVDSPEEIGLWYRLAPISFLGGSLLGQGALRDPMEAAALGSAILHGPMAGSYGMAFGRLGAARATRAVATAQDLAEALGDLLAPDRAARLAQAAWTVASDGAEATDALLARIQALLEDKY